MASRVTNLINQQGTQMARTLSDDAIRDAAGLPSSHSSFGTVGVELDALNELARARAVLDPRRLVAPSPDLERLVPPASQLGELAFEVWKLEQPVPPADPAPKPGKVTAAEALARATAILSPQARTPDHCSASETSVVTDSLSLRISAAMDVCGSDSRAVVLVAAMHQAAKGLALSLEGFPRPLERMLHLVRSGWPLGVREAAGSWPALSFGPQHMCRMPREEALVDRLSRRIIGEFSDKSASLPPPGSADAWSARAYRSTLRAIAATSAPSVAAEAARVCSLPSDSPVGVSPAQLIRASQLDVVLAWVFQRWEVRLPGHIQGPLTLPVVSAVATLLGRVKSPRLHLLCVPAPLVPLWADQVCSTSPDVMVQVYGMSVVDRDREREASLEMVAVEPTQELDNDARSKQRGFWERTLARGGSVVVVTTSEAVARDIDRFSAVEWGLCLWHSAAADALPPVPLACHTRVAWTHQHTNSPLMLAGWLLEPIRRERAYSLAADLVSDWFVAARGAVHSRVAPDPLEELASLTLEAMTCPVRDLIPKEHTLFPWSETIPSAVLDSPVNPQQALIALAAGNAAMEPRGAEPSLAAFRSLPGSAHAEQPTLDASQIRQWCSLSTSLYLVPESLTPHAPWSRLGAVLARPPKHAARWTRRSDGWVPPEGGEAPGVVVGVFGVSDGGEVSLEGGWRLDSIAKGLTLASKDCLSSQQNGWFEELSHWGEGTTCQCWSKKDEGVLVLGPVMCGGRVRCSVDGALRPVTHEGSVEVRETAGCLVMGLPRLRMVVCVVQV
jgi:hypothetical protein